MEKFDDKVRLVLFKDFWAMGSYNRSSQYISDLIEKVVTIRKQGSNKHRTGTAIYYFRINSVLKRTCKNCFRRTFDISNKFIDIIIKNKKLGT